MRIAITGSRSGITEADVAEMITPCIGQGHSWILGGAMGVDNFALILLHDSGEDLVVYVAVKIGNQPTGNRNHEYLNKVEVVEINDPRGYNGASLYDRNIAMLENRGNRVDLVIAFPSCEEVDRGSGTWNCVHEAQRRGIEVVVAPFESYPSI